MELTDLWWSAIGAVFLFGPFVVVAFIGVALPAGAVMLAREQTWQPPEIKLAGLLGLLVCTDALSVLLGDRVLFTERELLRDPTVVYSALGSPSEPWVNRLGSLLMLAIAVPEIVRWLMGATTMSPRARTLWLAACLYYFVSMVLAGVAGEMHYFGLRLLYMPLVLTGLALLSQAPDRWPLQTLRCTLWASMVGSLAYGALVPTGALERDYVSMLPGLTWRLIGLAEHANSLGALAVVALATELSPRVGRTRWFMLLPSVAVLVLAQSKTAWVEALLVIALVRFGSVRSAVFGNDRTAARLGVAAALSFLVAAGVVVGAWLLGSDRGQGWLDRFNVGTLTGRTQIWAITLAEFENSPWLGYGPALWDLPYRYSHGMPHVGQAHNQYIHTLGQAGLMGALALALYVGVMVKLAWNAWRDGDSLPLVVVVVLLVRGLTETPLTMASATGADALFHGLAFLLAAGGGQARSHTDAADDRLDEHDADGAAS